MEANRFGRGGWGKQRWYAEGHHRRGGERAIGACLAGDTVSRDLGRAERLQSPQTSRGRQTTCARAADNQTPNGLRLEDPEEDGSQGDTEKGGPEACGGVRRTFPEERQARK